MYINWGNARRNFFFFGSMSFKTRSKIEQKTFHCLAESGEIFIIPH